MYRLWQTYSACEGEVVRLPDIVDGYCRNEINDKENCPRENELGRIILRIFPEVKKVQKLNHEDGMKKKCWRYSNIKKMRSPYSIDLGKLSGDLLTTKANNIEYVLGPKQTLFRLRPVDDYPFR